MSKVKKVFKAVKKIASSPLGGIALGALGGPLGSALGGGVMGGALAGAGLGALSGGGLKGALLGGITGGAGSYITGGGSIPGLGSIGKNVPLNARGYGPSQIQPSGILGAVSKGLSNLGTVSGAGAGGGSSVFSGNSLSNILSGVNTYGAQEDMEDKLLEQQRKAASALKPYQNAGLNAQQQLSASLAGGFDPTKVGDDAGYQFNLAQGLKAQDRAASARGGFYSGQALKDSQRYGQDLANNYVNDYYARWAGTNDQLGSVAGRGLNAAGALTGVYDNVGNIKANAKVGMNNSLTGMLSGVLSGSGAKGIIGYRPDGTPIYDGTISMFGA